MPGIQKVYNRMVPFGEPVPWGECQTNNYAMSDIDGKYCSGISHPDRININDAWNNATREFLKELHKLNLFEYSKQAEQILVKFTELFKEHYLKANPLKDND